MTEATTASTTRRRDDVRAAVVEVAARLLHEQGPTAVTTRGVAEAAGVQAPAIYRLFGDKDGLMDAVAEHVMLSYATAKATVVATARTDDVDALVDLRSGWDSQVAFGLANPALFRLLSDPERVRSSPAAVSGRRVLEARVHRVAETGRLRVSERRAADLLQAAGIGVIHSLLATPPDERDLGLADALFDAVLTQVLTQVLTEAPEGQDDGLLAAAVALRAAAPGLDALSGAEQQLMAEWLDRTVDARSPTPRRIAPR